MLKIWHRLKIKQKGDIIVTPNTTINHRLSMTDELKNNPVAFAVITTAVNYLGGAIIGVITATCAHRVGRIFAINQVATLAIGFLIVTLAKKYKWSNKTIHLLNALNFAITGVALILTLKSAGIIATLGRVILSVGAINQVLSELKEAQTK